MRILSLKPGHDATIAFVRDSRLEFSLESEKDSFLRNIDLTPNLVLNALALVDEVPDAVCISGWMKGFRLADGPLEAGYHGFDEGGIITRPTRVLSKQVQFFSSTHERSHLIGAYSMSPFAQGTPCYALVWEGNIGSFYEIDEKVRITRLGDVLEGPGNKYAFLFALADRSALPLKGYIRLEDAGKLMALAAYSDHGPPTPEETEVIDFILSRRTIRTSTSKGELRHSRFYNIGVEHLDFKNLAGKFSDSIFDRFFTFAREHLTRRLPLLISGGCGLNCEWNTRWRSCGLFPDVFVPPCTNDTGSAIGTAADAQLYYTGNAKLAWDVYAGEEFVIDASPPADEFDEYHLDYRQVARFLEAQKVIGWVQGRAEIGPRALGNRSILAAPFEAQMRDRLNTIKQREAYRPVAPVCLEEDVSEHFDWSGPSPYMLYFQRLKTDRLAAVTHVDNSARIQTVSEAQNGALHRLLMEFKSLTGYGVLCNTSLNFKGRGFVNRMSDLLRLAREQRLDGLVVNQRLYVARSLGQSSP